MTTNERLVAAGLLELFDAAARSRNRDEMVRILGEVDISEVDARGICGSDLSVSPEVWVLTRRDIEDVAAD
jgi:hypothetical protein